MRILILSLFLFALCRFSVAEEELRDHVRRASQQAELAAQSSAAETFANLKSIEQSIDREMKAARDALEPIFENERAEVTARHARERKLQYAGRSFVNYGAYYTPRVKFQKIDDTLWVQGSN